MKKFTIKVLLFLILILLVQMPISILIQKDYHTKKKQEWALNIKNKEFDYAFLGSSRVLNLIDVNVIDSITNKVGVNLGISGVGYADNYILFQKFLENNKLNKLYLNLDPYSLSSNISFSYPFTNYAYLKYFSEENIKLVYKDMMPTWKYYLWELISISKFLEYNNFRVRYYSDFSSYDKNKGSILLTGSINSNKLTFNKNQTKYFVDSLDLKYLKKIINLCKLNNIECILLTTPIHVKAFEKYNNLEEMFLFIDTFVCKEKRKYISNERLFDCSEDKYFKDINHLNKSGAKLYSMNLAKFIKDS
jgi:hypothetical protein